MVVLGDVKCRSLILAICVGGKEKSGDITTRDAGLSVMFTPTVPQ